MGDIEKLMNCTSVCKEKRLLRFPLADGNSITKDWTPGFIGVQSFVMPGEARTHFGEAQIVQKLRRINKEELSADDSEQIDNSALDH